ncbi:hypothetical protein F5Y04DRAFT_184998 [Hypomontagnella monticulosa]|nr:hypothetical protein F5Y04DRAFT_184998 [Hypomontagnella monticulosa]
MYSPGATAGIAVGSAFAAATIVTIVFTACWLTRQRRKTIPKPSPPRHRSILDDLPQDIAHDVLRQEFSRLESQIKTVVANYFHDEPLRTGSVNSDKLDAVLGGNAINATNTQWSTHLCDTSTRPTFLKLYIARVLCARIEPANVSEATLLPLDVVRCYQAALLKSRHSYSPELLEHWRATTAFLLAERYPQDRLVRDDTRARNIKRAVADLLDALQPFRKENSEQRSIDALESLATRFAVLGFKLFSQIDRTEIVWPGPLSSANRTVIFPALRQHNVDEGRDITIRDASLE